ncbi:MAG: PD40 domain-containing protein [Chlorobi bacterium]|nr:PD40 domain-containing protein [Chlorobiota bacterium]
MNNKKYILSWIILCLTGFLFNSAVTDAADKVKRVWTVPHNIEQLNTPDNDFAPTYNRFDKLIYFNSDRNRSSKFYRCAIGDSLRFTVPTLVTGSLNEKRANRSYLSFESKDIARLSAYDMKDDRSYMNIHSTRRLRDNLISPVLTEELADESFNAHPTISPDGTMMIFSSNRNSAGETDLWTVFKNIDNTWGSLIRITELSTPGNEITPFLASADTLIFASDGHEGPGGYDLFISVKSEGRWQAPDPLLGVNTESNESDPLLLPNGRMIFASDRPDGKGKLDLYISEPQDLKNEAGEIPNTTMFLSPQVSSVRVKTESFAENFAPSQIFLINDEAVFVNPSTFSEKNISANPDSVYKYSLGIIASGMKNNPQSKINLICASDNTSEVYAEKIKDYLVKNCGIVPGKVKIKSSRNNNKNYISIESRNSALFPFVNLGDENVQIIPPVLEITADARPRGHITSWECNFSIENKLDKTVKTGTSLPEKFLIDLKPYKENLAAGYSFTIDIRGRDSSGRIAEKRLEMSISHSSGNRLTTRNGRLYSSYVMITEQESAKSLAADLSKQIKSELAENANIIIEYYSQNTAAIKTAKVIQSKLKKFGKTDIRQNSIEAQNISAKLRPYVFRVLIEKK